MKWTRHLEQVPRLWMAAGTVSLVLLVGVADYLTGYEILFFTFYLVAVALASWFIGRGFGAFLSVLSVASQLIGDVAAGAKYSSVLTPVWNAVISLVFYLVVVWLLNSLRSLQTELENRVRQRTEALTVEMAERAQLEKELLGISERERRRLGHDLHDSLCQHLTGTALAGQVLEEKLAAQGRPEAGDASKVVGLVEEAIDLTRTLARGLHPVALEAQGLMSALEELAAQISSRFQLSCRFECDTPVFVNDIAVSTHLYRMAQEAVSNAIKHGKARHIVIHLSIAGDEMTLSVRDDGVGLQQPPPQNRGMGLQIMAHRATMIGGTLRTEPVSPQGTVVVCQFPAPLQLSLPAES